MKALPNDHGAASGHALSHDARPLLAIFLLIALPLLIGPTIAPYVFNGMRTLAEHTDIAPKLLNARFEKVTSRCVMLVAALILFPVLRMTGLLPEIRRGLTRSRDRFRELGWGVAIGCVSIIAIYAFGWLQGAYVVSPKFHGLADLAGRFTISIIGAVIIGFFEETFFRGFIFGALRVRLGFFTALILSSVFFSGIHFFRPLYPNLIDHASWNTGFALFPYMFEKFVWPRDVSFALTLFIIGLTLATFYHKRGNLYLIIGLHGGWVLAMQTGSRVFDRQPDAFPLLFGHGDMASKGILAVLVICVFLIAAVWHQPKEINRNRSRAYAND
jgi:membrane protease YdiL (CAAX protease family)